MSDSQKKYNSESKAVDGGKRENVGSDIFPSGNCNQICNYGISYQGVLLFEQLQKYLVSIAMIGA